MLKLVLIIISIALLNACASTPVLYPNHYYKQVGKSQANEDIKSCEHSADEYLKSPQAKKILRSSAKGSVFGAIWGFIWGIFTGDLWLSTAIGAAGGAATGAAAGAMSPDELKRHYIDKCLADKGYQVIGWD